MSKVPEYASEIPFVPVNWGDRDAIVGKLMEILEAVMPEGRQLEATKELVKKSLNKHFKEIFNNQYEVLTTPLLYENTGMNEFSIIHYYKAMWEETQKHIKIDSTQ